jgi:hypothetical protein
MLDKRLIIVRERSGSMHAVRIFESASAIASFPETFLGFNNAQVIRTKRIVLLRLSNLVLLTVAAIHHCEKHLAKTYRRPIGRGLKSSNAGIGSAPERQPNSRIFSDITGHRSPSTPPPHLLKNHATRHPLTRQIPFRIPFAHGFILKD